MLNKIGPVKNPLTIIAIVAGIAEVSGTVVLPDLSTGNQSVFIWFLMLFPMILVILFFCTLNWNHKVLYAPSDYADDASFLQTLEKQIKKPANKFKTKLKSESPVRITIEKKEFTESPLKNGQ